LIVDIHTSHITHAINILQFFQNETDRASRLKYDMTEMQ